MSYTDNLQTAKPDSSSERILFNLRNPNYEDLLMKERHNNKDELKKEGSAATATTHQKPEEEAKNNTLPRFMDKFIPSGLVKMELEPSLLELLQSNETFATLSSEPENEHFENLGYCGPLNDGAHMKKSHIYHEGYFHASTKPSPSIIMSSGGETTNKSEEEKEKTSSTTAAVTDMMMIDAPIDSMNPRFGHNMDKPAAPRALRAFLLAFKKVNRPWLEELIQKLDLPFLTMESVFADIAAQSHFGSEVKISPSSFGGWHYDASNSILHLAVSLHGERYLHFNHHRLASEEEDQGQEEKETEAVEEKPICQKTASNKRKDWAEDAYTRVKNVAGSVYLTSPSAFKHAVEYTECDYKSRILAIQIRTLLDSKKQYRDLQSKVDWSMKEKIVGQVFREQKGIRLPTTEEVLEILLSQIDEVAKSPQQKQQKETGNSGCVVA